jgi:hypothetical protein
MECEPTVVNNLTRQICPQLQIWRKYRISYGDGYPMVLDSLTRPQRPSITKVVKFIHISLFTSWQLPDGYQPPHPAIETLTSTNYESYWNLASHIVTVTRRLWTTSPNKIFPQLQILPKSRISHGDGYPTVVNNLTRPAVPDLRLGCSGSRGPERPRELRHNVIMAPSGTAITGSQGTGWQLCQEMMVCMFCFGTVPHSVRIRICSTPSPRFKADNPSYWISRWLLSVPLSWDSPLTAFFIWLLDS